jgi:hypothetical protein
MSLDKKRELADYCIDNNSSVSNTEKQVDQLMERLKPSMVQKTVSLAIRYALLLTAAFGVFKLVHLFL